MGSIRGAKKRKKSDKKDVIAAVAATPFYSQPHQPFDWWYHFSNRITGIINIIPFFAFLLHFSYS
jgi:hypothetical protein